jgi:hypothetical protein
MSNRSRPIKTAVVCMVYNGYEYLSEFLAHYRLLCDELFIIDHNSQNDLRGLNLERVHVVRSNHEAQFQSECTNTVIEHFKIKDRFDWLFVVDIDEFIPFSNRWDLHTFLERYQSSKVLQFFWRNGVPFYNEAEDAPQSLIDCTSIRFFGSPGRQYKSFVNIKKTEGQFFVPTGAHHISKMPSWLDVFPCWCRNPIYKATISPLPLYHILAFNKTAFVKKIKNYVHQMSYREHIKGQGGWIVRDYPDELSDDQWLWYVANFRVGDPSQFYDVKKEDFIESPVLSHLDQKEVVSLRERILDLDRVEKQAATSEEKEYLSYKEDDRNVVENIKWFMINDQNEIRTHIPGTKK